MIAELESRQKLELKELLKQNECLHKKKSDQLIGKLEAVRGRSGGVNFLKNINLPQALQSIQQVVARKKLEIKNGFQSSQEIDRELLQEYSAENRKLVEQINELTIELDQIRDRKNKFILAQKHTSTQILALQQASIKRTLDLRKQDQSYLKKNLSPCLSFAYQRNQSGIFEFKKSYQAIIRHFIKRIEENQQILVGLQASVKDRVKQSESIRAHITRCKSLTKYYEDTSNNVEDLKRKCEQAKQEVRKRVEAANEQVNARLPHEIDKKVGEIHANRHNYERAYFALLQVVNKVVHNADLSRVTDYINQT